MIKMYTKEYTEGGCAVKLTAITFFCIPIYKRKDTTTNGAIIASLNTNQSSVKVKGFYEIKNKNKESRS